MTDLTAFVLARLAKLLFEVITFLIGQVIFSAARSTVTLPPDSVTTLVLS